MPLFIRRGLMGVYGSINKEYIDEAYRYGLVKPNEYETIRDNIIAREIFLRAQCISSKIELTLPAFHGRDLIEDFYLRKTGYINIKDAILHLAYNESDILLIDQDDISILILADVAYTRACKVRDLGDVNKSTYLDGIILADKDTIRSLEYLVKYKRGLWDLLECLKEEN